MVLYVGAIRYDSRGERMDWGVAVGLLRDHARGEDLLSPSASDPYHFPESYRGTVVHPGSYRVAVSYPIGDRDYWTHTRSVDCHG